MKKNQKGFMLAETLIVATFISVTLVYLFVQFRNINNNYSKTLKYNGVNELYILEQVSNYLQINDIDEVSSSIVNSDKNYFVLSECNKNVFKNVNSCQNLFDMADIKSAVYLKGDNLVNSNEFSNKLNDYIKTIKKSDNMFILVCEFNDGSIASIKVGGYKYLTLKESIEVQDKVDSGNGLYFENSVEPIYVYKGNNMELLNNNIEIFGYEGRIILSNSQGIKVYLELTDNLVYDNNYSYFTSLNRLISGNYLEKSSSDSLLFTNLNSNIESSDYIKIGAKYGVGKIDNVIGNSLNDIIESENSVVYQVKNLTDYVATLNISDIIRTSINVGCNYGNISNNCLNDNWLTNDLWTMNYQNSSEVWSIDNTKFTQITVGEEITKNAYKIVYLDPNIIVTGDGSKEHPFKIR